MKKMVLLLIFTFIVINIQMFSQSSSFAISSPPVITAPAAILIDATTGQILFDKNMHELMEPASTTKVMTALLTLEHLPLDKVITIDPISPYIGGSRIFVIEGEELTVEQLLYATMLLSANDASVALAIAISGSVEEFASLMNERAREAGARNPAYVNPSGLHSPGHFASAYDLAMVAKVAMQNQRFRQIVTTVQYTIPETNRQPIREYIHNTNRMLFDRAMRVPIRGVMTPVMIEGVTGIKTGTTPQAGSSLVSSAKRDGTEFIAVVLGTTDALRYGYSIALLEYGFDNFFTHKAVDASRIEIEDVRVRRGAFNRVTAEVLHDKYITLPRQASVAVVRTEIAIEEYIAAPVEVGQQIGRVEIFEGGELIGEVPIIATTYVEEGGFLSRFGIEDNRANIIRIISIVIGSIFGVIILFYIVVTIMHERRRVMKRKARALQIVMERESKQKEAKQREWPY